MFEYLEGKILPLTSCLSYFEYASWWNNWLVPFDLQKVTLLNENCQTISHLRISSWCKFVSCREAKSENIFHPKGQKQFLLTKLFVQFFFTLLYNTKENSFAWIAANLFCEEKKPNKICDWKSNLKTHTHHLFNDMQFTSFKKKFVRSRNSQPGIKTLTGFVRLTNSIVRTFFLRIIQTKLFIWLSIRVGFGWENLIFWYEMQ